MLRADKLTVKRLIETKLNGEWSSVEEVVYSNIPCHLAVRSLDDVQQTQSRGVTPLDFKLFLDTAQKVKLQLNDIAEVKTSQGQAYTLWVGEGFIYPLTSQYQLKRDKIV